jgi:CheY-like chemotaxis protein
MNDPILYVEDGSDDILFMQRAFRKIAPEVKLHIITNGQEAADFFDPGKNQEGARIALSLVLLDLNLPGRSGLEVLAQIKKHSNHQTVPIVVFSASDQQKDIEACYQQGCNAYVVKPNHPDGLKRLVSLINDFWLNENRYSKVQGGVAIVSDQDTLAT